MASFDTPEPITLSVELGSGTVRVAAGERRDTVVEVRPSDPTKRSDVTTAEQTLVEYAEGTLTVRAPRRWAQYVLGAGSEAVDIQIAVPAGSRLRVEAPGGAPAVRASGRLGDCHVKIGAGEIRLGGAGSVQLRTGAGDVTVDRVAGQAEIRTGAGDVTVDHVAGRAEISTGTGSVRIGAIEGAATIRGATGDTWIGEVGGDLEVRVAYGGISVDRAEHAVAAKTPKGDVHLGEVVRGAISAQTGFGKVDVGVRDGVAAWLDLQTRFGNVLNELDGAGPPQPGEETVEVRARSSFGDITVRRS